MGGRVADFEIGCRARPEIQAGADGFANAILNGVRACALDGFSRM